MLSEEELEGSIGKGWIPFVKPVLAQLDALDWEVAQIKEKFGGLRLYVEAAPKWVSPQTREEISEAIHAAEELSYKVCEVCGEPGKLRSGGWWKTLCEKHHEEREGTRFPDEDEGWEFP